MSGIDDCSHPHIYPLPVCAGGTISAAVSIWSIGCHSGCTLLWPIPWVCSANQPTHSSCTHPLPTTPLHIDLHRKHIRTPKPVNGRADPIITLHNVNLLSSASLKGHPCVNLFDGREGVEYMLKNSDRLFVVMDYRLPPWGNDPNCLKTLPIHTAL